MTVGLGVSGLIPIEGREPQQLRAHANSHGAALALPARDVPRYQWRLQRRLFDAARARDAGGVHRYRRPHRHTPPHASSTSSRIWRLRSFRSSATPTGRFRPRLRRRSRRIPRLSFTNPHPLGDGRLGQPGAPRGTRRDAGGKRRLRHRGRRRRRRLPLPLSAWASASPTASIPSCRSRNRSGRTCGSRCCRARSASPGKSSPTADSAPAGRAAFFRRRPRGS